MQRKSIISYLSPSERVRLLLKKTDPDGEDVPRRLFIQMDELQAMNQEETEHEWRQVARWVRFEETVEGQGERWSKPHVSTVSLKSMIDLRRLLQEGAVLLHSQADTINGVTKDICDTLNSLYTLTEEEIETISACMLRHHSHQYLRKKDQSMFSALLGVGLKTESRTESAASTPCGSPVAGRKFGSPQDNMSGNNNNIGDVEMGAGTPLISRKANKNFMRKLPEGTEAANILVGELSCLQRPYLAVLRLQNPVLLPGLTEVHVNTKFLFLLLGPARQAYNYQYYHVGRCWATLLCDEVFHDVAYLAQTPSDIVLGLDDFLEAVTLLPPANWDPAMRLDPPPHNPPSRRKKRLPRVPTKELLLDVSMEQQNHEDPDNDQGHGNDPSLVRTGRLFGGLVEDVRRKVPFYASDFRDAVHPQCLASFVFLYFAAFTPIITFGGLLGLGTDNYMATMECILAGAVCGVLFHLFSGQPLNVLGPTGPMLVLEVIIYNFSASFQFNYLAFRCWIGLWTSLFLVLLVAFDLSALVRYITRFTEEAFACLISTIFIYDAISKLLHIYDYNPLGLHGISLKDAIVDCYCTMAPPENGTTSITTQPSSPANSMVTTAVGMMASVTNTTSLSQGLPWSTYDTEECEEHGGVMSGSDCGVIKPVPDVFLFSILLFIATFMICYTLNNFRGSSFFPAWVRNITSDFAVFIAIVLTTGLDWVVDIRTPKLRAPEEFHPTRQDARGWFINPIQDNPWWLALAAAVPAILATILIFMDQQITAVIVNRKENKLKKGIGYHLDMFVMSIVIVICSVLGLPWFVASTVVAITHVTSLNLQSECTAPGERPQFIGIREQRVTGIAAHLMIGLSVFFTPLLKHVPMPVLYGVFMYMGVNSLRQIQFVRRFLLLLMPPKYQPDYKYLREVPARRVHLYTAIQLVCFMALWIVKKIQAVSITFPLMVLALCVVRKVVLERIFTTEELSLLDSILPAKKPQEDQQSKNTKQAETKLTANSTFNSIPSRFKSQEDVDAPDTPNSQTKQLRINMSEEIDKTGLWLNPENNRTRSVTPDSWSKDSAETLDNEHKKC